MLTIPTANTSAASYQIGIINSTSHATFEPDKSVTAVKMVVAALGYSVPAAIITKISTVLSEDANISEDPAWYTEKAEDGTKIRGDYKYITNKKQYRNPLFMDAEDLWL